MEKIKGKKIDQREDTTYIAHGGSKCFLEVVEGCGETPHLWVHEYIFANAVIFIMDPMDEDRKEEAKKYFEFVMKDQNLVDVPVYLLVNLKENTEEAHDLVEELDQYV